MQYSNPYQADHNRFCLPLHYTYAYIISLWKAKERTSITEITTPEQLYVKLQSGSWTNENVWNKLQHKFHKKYKIILKKQC